MRRAMLAALVFPAVAWAQASPGPMAPARSIARAEPRQEAHGEPAVFEIGMTRQAVRERFGDPELYYEPRGGRHYTEEEYLSALRVFGKLFDVYHRKVDENEYEIRVGYVADTTESRLHPTTRVSRIIFVVDKPRPARETLNQLLEAKLLCQLGCSLLGVRSSSFRIEVSPQRPSAEQQHLAQLVASGGQAGGGTRGWLPMIWLEWQDQRSGMDRVRNRNPQLEWWLQPVEEISLIAWDPNFERDLTRRYPSVHISPVDLGMWAPQR